MKTIQKAGAVVLSKDNPENILLLYSKILNDWTFPKGHIESGENAEQTMIREIKEETGLTVTLLTLLPDIIYTNEFGLVTIKMFLVSSQDDAQLKTEKVGDQLAWIRYTELKDRLTYDNLKVYVDLIMPILESHIVN